MSRLPGGCSSRGSRSGPGEVSAEEVRSQIWDGQWFVVRGNHTIVAGLRLLWSDDLVWGPQPADSAYVHSLVVDRCLVGQGLGFALLKWAEGRARAAGRSHLRLDCVETNRALRIYYARAGFHEVGRRDFDGPWHSAVLFEKGLSL